MAKNSKKYFLTGLLIVLPVLVTAYLFISLFLFFDNILGRYISRFTLAYFGYRIPGLGLLVFLVLIFAAGFFATHFIGRRLLHYAERLWLKFPLIKKVYPAAKQITKFFFAPSPHGQYQKVVLVQYPSKGIYTLAFVTNEADKQIQEKAKKRLLSVLIPSVPNPLTGFLVLIPSDEVVFLDLSIEEAVKIYLSGGVLNPKDILETYAHPFER